MQIQMITMIAVVLAMNPAPPASGQCGHPLFHSAPRYAVGEAPYSGALGDLNGDGRLDMAVANYSGDDVSVLLNNGDGTFAPAGSRFAASCCTCPTRSN